MNFVDNIDLHRKTREVIYSELLQNTIGLKKLCKKIKNLEKQLKEEKVENKAWKKNINMMEQNIVSLGVDPKYPKPIHSIIDEKEKKIQLLKRKLQIPSIAHV